MRTLRCGERRFATQLRATGEGLAVTLAGRSFRFAVEEEAAGVYVLRDGRRRVRFHVARDGGAVHLFWDGAAYALTEEREGTRASRQRTRAPSRRPCRGG